MKRWGPWLAVLLLSAACGDDGAGGSGTEGSSSGDGSSTSPGVTTDDPSSSTSAADSSSGTSADTTSGSPSNCSGTCAPPIPNGWTGPVKVGGNVVDCNGGFADPAGAFFTDFDPGEDECSCECSPVDPSCAATVEVQVWGAGGCAGDPDYTFDLGTDVCTSLGDTFPPALDDKGAAAPLSMDFFTIGPVVIEGGTCEGVASFNEGGFGASVQLCAPTALPSMCDEGGPCIADNTDVCVWQEGEHDCPDGYGVATVGFSGSDDARECGDCDCGAPEGLCDSSIVLQTAECGGGAPISNDDCVNSGAAAIENATYDAGDVTVACGGGTGTAPLTGSVEATGPVTICCAR